MSRTHHHGLPSKKKPWVKRPTGYNFYTDTPSWWTRLYMNRPRRHRDDLCLKRISSGLVDVDAAIFSVGGHRPHVYYW